MKIYNYPDEIAVVLCELATNEYDAQTEKDVEQAVYHLMAAAQNEKNADYFRTLYRVLECITQKN